MPGADSPGAASHEVRGQATTPGKAGSVERLPSRRLVTTAGAGPSSFVPVSILDPGAGAQLEIELSNACVLRLKGVIDPSLLETAIAAAGRLNGSLKGAN